MFEPKVTGFSWTFIEKDDDKPKTAMEVEEQRQRLERRMEWLHKNVTYGAFGGQRQGKQKLLDTLKDDPVKAYIDKDIELTEQFIIKENKENIKMTNTDLIDNKLQKELDALRKAKVKEIKDKFYETPIGKAAKAFNEALEQNGSENQKDNYLVDMDDLMERGEEKFIDEINAKYDIKWEEAREYYNEAKNLFLNADTYEQKYEILTSYGILKGPKQPKAKVEVK